MKECKVCEHEDCKHINLVVISPECEGCGRDIQFVNIIPMEEAEAKRNLSVSMEENEMSNVKRKDPVFENHPVRATMVLRSLKLVNQKDGKEIPLPLTTCVLGREGSLEPQYFNQSTFVSRKHAEIKFSQEKFFIKDLDSQNGTFINNSRLDKDKQYEVKIGDTLIFGNMGFLVE